MHEKPWGESVVKVGVTGARRSRGGEWDRRQREVNRGGCLGFILGGHWRVWTSTERYFVKISLAAGQIMHGWEWGYPRGGPLGEAMRSLELEAGRRPTPCLSRWFVLYLQTPACSLKVRGQLQGPGFSPMVAVWLQWGTGLWLPLSVWEMLGLESETYFQGTPDTGTERAPTDAGRGWAKGGCVLRKSRGMTGVVERDSDASLQDGCWLAALIIYMAILNNRTFFLEWMTKR